MDEHTSSEHNEHRQPRLASDPDLHAESGAASKTQPQRPPSIHLYLASAENKIMRAKCRYNDSEGAQGQAGPGQTQPQRVGEKKQGRLGGPQASSPVPN
jgi:hypothetical protein